MLKNGICHIILLITLSAAVGCTTKDNANKTVSKRNEDIRRIASRFQDINLQSDRRINPAEFVDKDTAPYYLPGWPVSKLLVIPAHGLQDQNKISRKKDIGFKNLLNSQAPVVREAGITSPDIYFTAIFDNDIIDYTDYYFTNGAGFEFYHPFISSLALSRLLPGLKYSINYYGLNIVQNLYTPLKLNKPEILVGDRPFAAYLALGHQRISLSPESKRRLYTEFTIGVIGPGSLGNFSQAMIHSEEPIGWKYQVENDIVANYSLRYDQGLYSGKCIEVALFAGGKAGTLYDNAMAGIFLQLGNANNRYSDIFQTTGHQKPYKSRIRYYFSIDLSNKLVIYDATLQGGLFNKESAYTIEPDQIRRYLFTGTAGFGIGFGKYSLEADQVFLTPEFEGGRHHMWFRIKNIIRIN